MLRLRMWNFQGIIFIGTQKCRDIFKYAFNEVTNFRSRIITNQKLELLIRICQILWNWCQSFSENLLLRTLIFCPGNTLCIWYENKNFYKHYSFFKWIWRSICFKLGSVVTESNKCLPFFSRKKQIFSSLSDLRN